MSGTVDVSLDAWTNDATQLSARLQKAADLFHACSFTAPAMISLQLHVTIGIKVCTSIANACISFLADACPPKQCSTPLFRPRRQLRQQPPSPPVRQPGTHLCSTNNVVEPCLGAHGSIAAEHRCPLVIATFGWWEIIEPSDADKRYANC